MTNFRNSNEQTIRTLDDAALDSVVGGAVDNCIPGHTITGTAKNYDWKFVDQFARWTIGR